MACEGVSEQASARVADRSGANQPRVVGKVIMYATHDLIAPVMPFEGDAPGNPFALRPIADVPWPGTAIAAGQPIMTVFASGDDAAECASRLSELEWEWAKRLGIAGG
jgi:predicted ATP-grasp superfamily ATP-dependent carboligase